MNFHDLHSLNRGDHSLVHDALTWLEEILRPPKRSLEQAWKYLFVWFENTDKHSDHGEHEVAEDLCNYLVLLFTSKQQEGEDDPPALAAL